jgi:hypothetical protein
VIKKVENECGNFMDLLDDFEMGVGHISNRRDLTFCSIAKKGLV